MKRSTRLSTLAICIACFSACTTSQDSMKQKDIRLMTVAPGHFHAALVQKSMYPEVDSVVQVYAAKGPELDAYLGLINQYNARADNPTKWEEVVYTGDDFLEKMLQDRKGNVVVLAGNNRDKIDYITQSVGAGLNVLADKPMVIDAAGFSTLESVFAQASGKGVMLYDIMTERYEINTMMQKALSQVPDFFGGLVNGSVDNPAITKESVHHFFKEVSGKPLVRPAWFYDSKQQGEGIVDVTTHLVDLVQWESFPDQVIDYKQDIQLLSAKRWPTLLTPAEFERSTGSLEFPAFLSDAVDDKGNLGVFSNGEINYTLKGIHAKVSVIWNFEAPQGTGDTHYSIMRGKFADLIIRQGEEESYKPVLYVKTTGVHDAQVFESSLSQAIEKLRSDFPGLKFEEATQGEYRIGIDPTMITTHEEHFAQVTEKYLGFLKAGKLPDWEVPNMIAKYYLTTKALKEAETVVSP